MTSSTTNKDEAGDFRSPKKGNKKTEQNDYKEIIRRLRIQNKKLLEQLTSVRNKLKQVDAEKQSSFAKMNRAEQLNLLLAKALGSCGNCWGEDPNCIVCAGNGISGWQKVNKRLFNLYVLPALEKVYGLSKNIK